MKSLLVVLALGTVAHADPLAVTIKPATVTWKATAPVEVVLEVSNTSKTSQSIKVMNCSWADHWASSDPTLTWSPWGCDKNFAAPIDLAPGASRTWTLSMFATAAAKLGPHTLKLSFTPEGGARRWSNEVAISVAAADPPPADTSLRIEATPKTRTWRANVPVDVALVVTNTTKARRTFQVMSCSWREHWASADPQLTWDEPSCRRNGPSTIALEPGASRTWTLPMRAVAGATLGAHALKLSFTPKGDVARSSNETAITVVK